MKPQNEVLSGIGTTIFTVMSALANQHGAVNLGQGFPDYDGPADVIHAAAAALLREASGYLPSVSSFARPGRLRRDPVTNAIREWPNSIRWDVTRCSPPR